MNKQEVLKEEAIRFARFHINHKFTSFEGFDELQMNLINKVNGFHFDSDKAIFLKELLVFLPERIEEIKSNAGISSYKDTVFDKQMSTLQFYIQQELDILPHIAQIKSTNNLSRNKVFVSYSHADKLAVNELKRHFMPFREIDFWDDSKIQPGQKWKEEIDKALKQAKVAILLISADFFASDFITENELPPLLAAADKDGATVLTVILKPVAFEAYPDISQYQAMNAPNYPVSKMDENEKEELWVNVFRQAKKALDI